MLTRARIAVLVSGGGTNLQALLDAQRDGKMPHGEIVLVVSSRAGAYALTRAENAGVAAHMLCPQAGESMCVYAPCRSRCHTSSEIKSGLLADENNPCHMPHLPVP